MDRDHYLRVARAVALGGAALLAGCGASNTGGGGACGALQGQACTVGAAASDAGSCCVCFADPADADPDAGTAGRPGRYSDRCVVGPLPPPDLAAA